MTLQETKPGRWDHSGPAGDSFVAAGPAASAVAESGDPGGRRVRFFAAALAALILLWASANIVLGGEGFAVIVSDSLRTSEEVASALVRFFAALVLVLFLSEEEGWRMGWVAAGLVALGFGHLAFGYLEPMIQGAHAGLDESLYEGLTTRIAAGVLFAVGLLPRARPRLAVRVAAIVSIFAAAAAYIFVFEFLEGPGWVPVLTLGSPERALELENSLGWITPWYMVISILPLGLTVAATAGAFRQSRRGVLPGWMLLAVVLLAGSSVHEYVWPTAYTGEVLATADLLRFLFATVVAVGGVTELRRIGMERASLLNAEREHTRRLGELSALRADFSAMVAHELGGPISAVRRLNEMLEAEGSSPEIRRYATATIEGEVGALDALVADVRAVAATERYDFEVKLRPIPLSDLLREAVAYAATLPGGHAVELRLADGLDGEEKRVWADRRRMAQVLTNLLSNAAKYSEEGAPIQLRARLVPGRVRVEVADHGPGIPPDEVSRIFEKFGRGHTGKKAPGLGLGLYLSRRIVCSHGSELTLETRPGEGAIFGFELEVLR